MALSRPYGLKLFGLKLALGWGFLGGARFEQFQLCFNPISFHISINLSLSPFVFHSIDRVHLLPFSILHEDTSNCAF